MMCLLSKDDIVTILGFTIGGLAHMVGAENVKSAIRWWNDNLQLVDSVMAARPQVEAIAKGIKG